VATTVMKEKLKKRRRKRRGELHNEQQPIALKSEDGEPEPVERGTHAPAGGGGSCGGCRQLLVPCWALELSGRRIAFLTERLINRKEGRTSGSV